jgi:3-oxoacyl-[acyl-carrier-protein] synthase II
MENGRHRVVITGLGSITSLGNNVDTFWENLLKGKSGIQRIRGFDTSEVTCQVGGEVEGFDPAKYMDFKEAKRNDRYAHFAVAAAKEALADAGISSTNVDPERFGSIISSGIGGLMSFEGYCRTFIEKGPKRVSPFMIPSLIVNIASGVVAIEVGARGPNYSVVSACASGSHAIGEAMRFIRYGDADVMLCGGTEAAVTELGYAGFCAMRAMSVAFNDEPERASRPFDAARDGFVMGEGAGVLVIENLEHAKARGARIYCELVGYGASCDAYHITSPDPEGKGLSLALRNALRDGNVTPSEVVYINAHGTSTPYNDKFETMAIKNTFGEHAYKLKVSSSKSMTGHLLGAAGGVEAAICAKVIQKGWIPPTINLENPDPDCDLDYVPNKAIQHPVRVAVSENLGFGGQNVALVMRAMD